MSKLPEDLVQKAMDLTGMSRDEAEKALSKTILDMINDPVFKAKTNGDKGSKRKYDAVNYPHFLPSKHIRKYTIRVSLKNTDLAIWRKFECPSNISLRHLTELFLKLMGWENEHLNQITVGRDTFYVPCYQNDQNFDWDENLLQEEYRLSDILNVKGKSVKWEYDFGDSWTHEIRLSSINDYAENELRKIIFKCGKGACPPEDCGGVWGYQELLELNDKRKSRKRLTDEEKERLEWYEIDKDYDPEFCDTERCVDVCNKFSDDNEIAYFSKNIDSETKEQLAKMSPLYDDILSLSFKIRELEPWEDLDDSDVYAIRMSDCSEIYVATMGNGGQSYDVQLYDGQESFQTYITMGNALSLPAFELMEAHNWAKYKSIMFQDPEDGVMEAGQYKLIEAWAKNHNIEIADGHGFPFPQNYRPHYYPTMQMSDEELIRFKEALEAIVWFSEQLLDAEKLTDLGLKPFREYPTAKGGKVVPLIVRTTDGYKVERTKLPGRITEYKTVSLPESEIQSLRFVQKSGAQFCRLIHAPGFIENGSNPYSLMVLLCVDKKDEYLTMTEMCELRDTLERDVLRQFIEKAKKEEKLPQRIITDDPRTEALLRDFCQQLGIILEFKRTRIPLLTHICQDMYDNMGK